MHFPSAESVARLASKALGVDLYLRDRGALESGLARGRNAYVYMGVSVFDAAALLAVGVIKNHPFVDGNKRVGWLCALTFLSHNGFSVRVDNQQDAVKLIEQVASGGIGADYLAGYLRRCCTPEKKEKSN